MRVPLGFRPVETRAVPGRRVLGIRHVLLGPAVRRELPPSAPPYGLGELGVGVVGEELPGGRGAPLLAHEEHRRERRGERQRGGAGQQPGGEGRRQPVPLGAVADLVVGLGVAEQPLRRDPRTVERTAVTAPAEAGIGAVVEEARRQRLAQRGERGVREVRVVALRLAGQRGVQRVMEVVVPLGVQPEAALLAGGDEPRVVEIRFGDQEERPAQVVGERVHGRRQLLQEMHRPGVPQRVHRVETQPVEPVVAQPGQRTAHEIRAHLVRAGRVEVHRGAPGRLVGVREVGPEGGQVVAGRAEMVVHDVQDDSQAEFVRPVDEALQRLGTAVRLVHRPQGDTLVPPAVPAGERAQRHQLDVRDAQFREVSEPARRRVQGALGGVRPHVQFVEDRARQRVPGPVGAPRVPRRVDHGAQSVGTVRLTARAGIGQDRPVVHREPVPGPLRRLRLARPPSGTPGITVQRARDTGAMERHPLGPWCPHLESHGRFPLVGSQ